MNGQKRLLSRNCVYRERYLAKIISANIWHFFNDFSNTVILCGAMSTSRLSKGTYHYFYVVFKTANEWTVKKAVFLLFLLQGPKSEKLTVSGREKRTLTAFPRNLMTSEKMSFEFFVNEWTTFTISKKIREN